MNVRLNFVAALVCGFLASLGGVYGSYSEIFLTKATAAEGAVALFVLYLKDMGMSRSAFGDPFVEISNGDALVSFRLLSAEDEGVIVSLGRDGSEAISPNIPSHDFPRRQL
jgi:hypothetical protein